MNEDLKTAVFNPALGVIAPTSVAKGQTLDTIIPDARIKYLSGAITEDQLKARDQALVRQRRHADRQGGQRPGCQGRRLIDGGPTSCPRWYSRPRILRGRRPPPRRRRSTKTLGRDLWRYRWLYLLLLPGLVYFLLFKYLPMYGLTIAFKDYVPFLGYSGSEWVGLKHFQELFTGPDFGRLMFNTLLLAVLRSSSCSRRRSSSRCC